MFGGAEHARKEYPELNPQSWDAYQALLNVWLTSLKMGGVAYDPASFWEGLPSALHYHAGLQEHCVSTMRALRTDPDHTDVPLQVTTALVEQLLASLKAHADQPTIESMSNLLASHQRKGESAKQFAVGLKKDADALGAGVFALPNLIALFAKGLRTSGPRRAAQGYRNKNRVQTWTGVVDAATAADENSVRNRMADEVVGGVGLNENPAHRNGKGSSRHSRRSPSPKTRWAGSDSGSEEAGSQDSEGSEQPRGRAAAGPSRNRRQHGSRDRGGVRFTETAAQQVLAVQGSTADAVPAAMNPVSQAQQMWAQISQQQQAQQHAQQLLQQQMQHITQMLGNMQVAQGGGGGRT